MSHSMLMQTPLGPLVLNEEDGAIASLYWIDGSVERSLGVGRDGTPLLKRAARQLDEYFAGRRRTFDLPLAPSGSAFDKAIWKALLKIPYGETLSYGDIARALDTSPRAIGGACGRNPITIVVPCHRVLAANGAIGGYSSRDGIATKRWLLGLERGLESGQENFARSAKVARQA